MSKRTAIVAELGRPETPEETAARKAESSRVYRSSQTFRNLIAALLVTLGAVAIVIFGVPRGEPASSPSIDLAGIAANVESSTDRTVLRPELDGWRVNAAELESGSPLVWDVTIAPSSQTERGFIRVAQAFDADASWAPQRLNGIAPTDTTRIDGREWDVFEINSAQQNANISYAIGTQAGTDYVLLYGARSPESTAELAEALSPQIREISEAP